MAQILKIFVTFLAILFVFGAIAAWNDWVAVNTYIVFTGIVGSLASIFGLVALGAPRLTAKDVRDVEADLFKKLSETAESVKKYEEQLKAGKDEMNKIAQERAELELLVRRAALKAFSEERLRYISIEVERRIESDITLSSLLDEYSATKERAAVISEELVKSQKAELLEEILSEFRGSSLSSTNKRFFINIFGNKVDLVPIVLSVGRMADVYVGAMSKSFKR